MPSATTIMEVRSISMPPNFSGSTTAVSPSSPDFLQDPARDSAAPDAGWRRRAARLPCCQNSSVVRAIARCSSVKSSGVKISSGALGSIRNAPPFGLGNRNCRGCHDFSLSVFENAGGALAAADAHRHHAVFYVAALHFTQDGGGEFRARATQRMSEGDGAAVEVERSRFSPASRITARACTAKASFNSMTRYRRASTGQRERFGNRHHRADAHDFRRHATDGETDESGHRLQPEFLRFLLAT